MKIINECQCSSEYLDFIRVAIEHTGYDVQQLRVMYCGPKTIFISLFFYDTEMPQDDGSFGEWIEREFLLRYRRQPRKNIVRYQLTCGLEADGWLICRGKYEYSEDFTEEGGV